VLIRCALESVKGRNQLGDPSINRRIILSWILGKRIVRMWTGFNRVQWQDLVSRL
jgi:hypothetical protein